MAWYGSSRSSQKPAVHLNRATPRVLSVATPSPCVSVHHEQSELGRAELGGRLSAPDAGLHEVAVWGVWYRRALLYQHPRWGAVPGAQRGPIPGCTGTADHQPAHTVTTKLPAVCCSLEKGCVSCLRMNDQTHCLFKKGYSTHSLLQYMLPVSHRHSKAVFNHCYQCFIFKFCITLPFMFYSALRCSL